MEPTRTLINFNKDNNSHSSNGPPDLPQIMPQAGVPPEYSHYQQYEKSNQKNRGNVGKSIEKRGVSEKRGNSYNGGSGQGKGMDPRG
jgi:hypothetical protein